MNFKPVSIFAFIFVCGAAELPAVSLAKNKTHIQGSISLEKKSKKEFSSLAKISMQDAINIAAKDHPGKIIEVALEKEDNFLVYEVELQDPSQNRKEILIDAGTGKVLLVKNENDDDDEDEND